jgi:hypothetical protein
MVIETSLGFLLKISRPLWAGEMLCVELVGKVGGERRLGRQLPDHDRGRRFSRLDAGQTQPPPEGRVRVVGGTGELPVRPLTGPLV